MAKTKEKQAKKANAGKNETESSSNGTHIGDANSRSSSASKSKPSKNILNPATAGSLIISRNKHWRYISSFHGAWLQLPVEIVEIVANLNYSTPRPRPMDPAVVFDVLKVRKNVDEATAFAVGAANDIASSTLINANSGLSRLGSIGHGAKLSKERKQRMRELSCQKLAKAYRLDEIACSVVTMQGTSALETVGGLVLQRKRDNLDAKYCHFFLEKIPSRQLVASTSLEPLTEIIASGHAQVEALRTRATVKIFQEDFDSAIEDLTEGLSLCRFRDLPHYSYSNASSRLYTENRAKFRNPNAVMSEEEQPTGLVEQLLFQRATVYLTQACRFVTASFPPKDTEESEEMVNARHECRKHIKMLARRALKDYMAFLCHFEYSPNLPKMFMVNFHRDIAIAAKQAKSSSTYSTLTYDHVVYNVTELFAALPPPDLPECPPQASSTSDGQEASTETSTSTMELVTYHPLMTEALHAFLLCHCLVQTSAKELQRHANMVARLVRLCDGDPIFRESRSAARTDWVETLRRTNNWINLSDTWETLCAPDSAPEQQQQPDHYSAAAASLLHRENSSSPAPAESKPGAQSVPLTAKANTYLPFGGPVPSGTTEFKTSYEPSGPYNRTSDDQKDYPYITERAIAIARWVCEAPIVAGTAKRKKRARKAGAKATVNGATEAMDNVTLSEEVGE